MTKVFELPYKTGINTNNIIFTDYNFTYITQASIVSQYDYVLYTNHGRIPLIAYGTHTLAEMVELIERNGLI